LWIKCHEGNTITLESQLGAPATTINQNLSHYPRLEPLHEELITPIWSCCLTIDLSPEIEARLKAKAHAEGISVGAYVERLLSGARDVPSVINRRV
jgi:hypothetical protein